MAAVAADAVSHLASVVPYSKLTAELCIKMDLLATPALKQLLRLILNSIINSSGSLYINIDVCTHSYYEHVAQCVYSGTAE
jgi:hypothetical protein